MRRLLYLSGAVACLCTALGGCSGKNEDTRGAQARSLYEKSLTLVRSYSDSMARAKDSAAVERLSEAYDEAVTKLNFNYPADTDPDMSEGENDTLARLTLRFVSLRDSLLYRFAHPLATPDSLASDTTFISQRPQSKSSLKE